MLPLIIIYCIAANFCVVQKFAVFMDSWLPQKKTNCS